MCRLHTSVVLNWSFGRGAGRTKKVQEDGPIEISIPNRDTNGYSCRDNMYYLRQHIVSRNSGTSVGLWIVLRKHLLESDKGSVLSERFKRLKE